MKLSPHTAPWLIKV